METAESVATGQCSVQAETSQAAASHPQSRCDICRGCQVFIHIFLLTVD